MKEAIIKKLLKRIEKENDITILFAVESGSRLWRIDSADSDYDVRFVYKRKTKDYLCIRQLPDVVNFMEGDKDFSGFDIFKFTKLLLSSNPSIVEWLKSDIVYRDDGRTKAFLLKFIEQKCNPIALYHHYRSMCKQNYLKYLKTGTMRTYKKYLYAMRGLVNARWVATYKTIPPIDFNETLEQQSFLPQSVTCTLQTIIQWKKKGKEKEDIGNIPNLDSFIENFLKKEEQVLSRKITDHSEVQEYLWKIIK